MYAEMSLVAIDETNKKRFEDVMMKRIEGLEKESQKRRVLKVLKRIKRIGG